ncbi:hypothetical protein ACQP04_03665 [Pseudonocardia halophobica]|uniref:hypothetical protein n=1 Tax=Pseudonocardia halophobica TaxID=29401 RepID=UPI003D90D76B
MIRSTSAGGRDPVLRLLLTAALAAALAVPGTPGDAEAEPVEPGEVRVIPAPTRAPLLERMTAEQCPELAPSRAGVVRRVAARSADEPAPVTELRRACSALRTGVATLLRHPAPAGSCAAACPDALREAISGARERAAPTAQPGAWTGGRTACTPPDPTGGDGCVTGATRHGVAAVAAAFGPLGGGTVIRSAGCWDAHAWNPRSDHPQGRACDFFPGTAGASPDADALAAGWAVANYLREHAGPLAVAYLIWQGRYWDPSVTDDGGWGRPYTSSVYDTSDVTGGHFDHVHVSFAQ